MSSLTLDIPSLGQLSFILRISEWRSECDKCEWLFVGLCFDVNCIKLYGRHFKMQTRKGLLITQRSEKITSYSLTSGLLTNHRTHECAFKKCMIQSCITWSPIFQFLVLRIIMAVFEWCTCRLFKNVVKKCNKK